MTTTEAAIDRNDILATILADENFLPAEPHSTEETGLSHGTIEALITKQLSKSGALSGRDIAERICLPFGVIEEILGSLRTRQVLVHIGSAPFNDYCYRLTDQGASLAQSFIASCAYAGPAPVPLNEYIRSVEAQTIRAEAPKREQLSQAFSDIAIDTRLFEGLGPAINSGAGLFLYGAPGNGKSTIARRITMCFGQYIWVPHAIIEDGQLIKIFDQAFHEREKDAESSLFKTSYDRRWVKIKRPTVVVGGELTMDGLELRHDAYTNISEAPLQLKSNCGCLLIDDFGRQRVEPKELLNRWIVPLENRIDFLTLSTGRKIQVPFEQLIIFSTNLLPHELVDEAFLRRIPYKLEVVDPSVEEFHALFRMYADTFGCEYQEASVDYLIKTHYLPRNRPMRRCHPRDLLSQIRNHCVYNDQPMEMLPDHFDRVVETYFAYLES